MSESRVCFKTLLSFNNVTNVYYTVYTWGICLIGSISIGAKASCRFCLPLLEAQWQTNNECEGISALALDEFSQCPSQISTVRSSLCMLALRLIVSHVLS